MSVHFWGDWEDQARSVSAPVWECDVCGGFGYVALSIGDECGTINRRRMCSGCGKQWMTHEVRGGDIVVDANGAKMIQVTRGDRRG